MSIVCGHRDETAQNLAYLEGKSKVMWPNGKHNSLPSKAVDVQPYPYNVPTLEVDLGYIAGLAVAFGAQMGVKIRWGGDWNQNGETADNKFDDLFHLEIVE
jgi:hypothetical protein